MFGLFVTKAENGVVPALAVSEMNKATREWELSAARGECAWVCADCGTSFPDGMPATCVNGIQDCSDLISRDKKLATESQLQGTTAG
jgi:hypothetical protein